MKQVSCKQKDKARAVWCKGLSGVAGWAAEGNASRKVSCDVCRVKAQSGSFVWPIKVVPQVMPVLCGTGFFIFRGGNHGTV